MRTTFKTFILAAAATASAAACQKATGPEAVPDFTATVTSSSGDSLSATIVPSEDMGTYYVGHIRKGSYTDDNTLVSNDLLYLETCAAYSGTPISEIISGVLRSGETTYSTGCLYPESDYLVYAYALDLAGNTGEVTKFDARTSSGFGFETDIIRSGPDSLVCDIRVSDKEVEYYPAAVKAYVISEYGGPDIYAERFMESPFAQFLPKFKGDIRYSVKLSGTAEEYYFLCYRYSDGKVIRPVYWTKFFSTAE